MVFSRAATIRTSSYCALQKKLTSPGIVTEIPDLIKAFQNSVKTDLSPQDIGTTSLPREPSFRTRTSLYIISPKACLLAREIYDPVFPEQKEGVFYWKVDFNITAGLCLGTSRLDQMPDDCSAGGTFSSKLHHPAMNDIPPLNTAGF